ncbi:hypothetical protein HpBGD38_14580 [Helicobacter pylori]|uniref:hypothetical protein n=1 Tax=Helicobacter pylori TaxID=210 RepID=UPI0036F3CB1E
MLETKTNKDNIAKYKEILLLEKLCETLINADEFSKVLVDFDKHLFAMLEACGLKYEIAKLK